MQENTSSSSDIKELQKALNGLSDRSDGVPFARDFVPRDSSPFAPPSDEARGPEEKKVAFKGPVDTPRDSDQDSFCLSEEEDAMPESLWERAAKSGVKSLGMLRQVTQRLESGGEMDQCIVKVLRNLTNKVLNDYADRDLSSLSKAELLDRQEKQVVFELATCLPILKLDEAKYLIGTEARMLKQK